VRNSLLIEANMKLNRPTTDFTIRDQVLMESQGLNFKHDRLAAVRALKVELFKHRV
jgi:hypothetical protein